MSNKVRVCVLFGGQSCEHEVSVTSARSMLAAMDPEKFDVQLVGIGKTGQWALVDDVKTIAPGAEVSVADRTPVLLDYPGKRGLVDSCAARPLSSFDVVFPLLHGPFGEDGTIQGLLELAGVPYVGAGVAASAAGMDKEMSRRVFTAEGIPQTDYCVYRRSDWQDSPAQIIAAIESRLPYPVFVKPVNLGSSVGVSKAHDQAGLVNGIKLALEYDRKVMIEASVENAREVECAVLGNDRPQASVVGEIIPGNEFYDYQTKYIDDNSQLVIPATLDPDQADTVRQLSIRAFRALDCAGLARVDFFIRRNTGEVLLNEINTMPGFTPISMYPKLWQASGLSYPELISRLIDLALQRFEEKSETRITL